MKYIICLICLCSGLNVFGQEIILEERFDEAFVAPTLGRGEASKIYLDHGGYFIENMKDGASIAAEIDILNLPYNMVVEASFTQLEGNDGTVYGISLGDLEDGSSEDIENTFNFWIRENDFNFMIGYPREKNSGWMKTSSLKKGEANHLKIEVKEKNDFYFYLNGQLVHTKSNYGYWSGGSEDLFFNFYNAGLVFIDDVLVTNMTPEKGEINFLNLEGVVRERVMNQYAEWAKRGEFETTAKYEVRMQQAGQKLEELTQQAIAHFKQEHIKGIKDYLISIMPYNAEEEYFMLKSEQTGLFKVHVPKHQARGFHFADDELEFKKFDFKIKDNAWVLTYVEVYNFIEQVTYYYDITKEPGYNPIHYAQTAKDFNISRPN